MRPTYPSYYRNLLPTILVIAFLLVASIGMSYSITRYGDNAGIAMLAGMLGLTLVVAAFLKPAFGLYIGIILGFTISVGERILYGIITLDFMIELVIYASFAGILFQNHLRGESLWKNIAHPVTYAFMAYFLFMVVEVFNPNASSIGGAVFHVRKTVQVFMVFVSCLYILQTYRDIRYYVRFWIFMSGLCGAYGCYQQWFGFLDFEYRWIMASEVRVAIYMLDNGSFRIFSSLTDPAAYGIIMACSGLLTIVMLIRSQAWKERLGLATALTFILLGMAYSGTRTATFVLVVGVALYVLMTLNDLKSLVFATFFALGFLFIMFAPIYGNVTINRLRSTFTFSEDNSYNVRNVNRKSIQPYIHAHPIGGGVMTAGVTGVEYNPGHPLAGFPPDSGLLKFALETGWIGLILVCALYFVFLRQGVHMFYRVKKPWAQTYLLMAVVTLFGYVLAQYSQVTGQAPQFFLFYPLVAMIIRISILENKKQKTL